MQSVYVFDVDGVLNDLKDYSPDQRILDSIIELLKSGVFVAINTERGYAWVEENIVPQLISALEGSEGIKNFFVSVEMGGLGIDFSDGTPREVRSAFSLPEADVLKVRQEFESHPKYSTTMHWYPKVSMATLAKNEDTPLDVFIPHQQALTASLTELFKERHIKITNSTDAIDVHAPEAGKWAGAELIYTWLAKRTDMSHDHFVCFGDSRANYEMVRFFAEQSHDAIFVCTNPSLDLPADDPNITIHRTKSAFQEGTFQYLSENL